MNLDSVNKLEDCKITLGERWIYSAGFNVNPDLRNTSRIDEEIEDIMSISDQGGIVQILSHQGRQVDGDVVHLDFVADYLSDKLGRGVEYFADNTSKYAQEFVETLGPGDICILGNTRFHPEEEGEDLGLAKEFASLGEKVAVGGFSKAHRINSSNVRILDYLPGYLTRSQVREMELLMPWAGKDDAFSVAVIGGMKKEKIKEGLVGFSKHYDAVIPGGIVLNTIYAVQGRSIGESLIEDGGVAAIVDAIRVSESENASKVHIPEVVVIADSTNPSKRNSRVIPIEEGVPERHMIVDFVLPDSAERVLERVVAESGRIVLAGTPGVYTNGFDISTKRVIRAMQEKGVKSIALGADTVSETGFEGTSSVGGGSSLYFLARGTTPVIEALERNKQVFNN